MQAQAMRQTRHVSREVRLAIQQSPESIRSLAERYGVNPKTVRRWRSRSSTESRKTGPHVPRSTVLTPAQEALIAAVRRTTLLALDDCLSAVQAFVPGLTRASLHRCLRRHGLSRLPKTPRRAEPGWFDLHVLDLGQGAGRSLFVAVERTTKYVFAEVREAAGAETAAAFLRNLAQAVPGHVRVICTEPGGPFAGEAPEFALACAVEAVQHRRIEPGWRRDQIIRVDQLVRQAVGEHSPRALARSLRRLVGLYNGRSSLMALGGRAPEAHMIRQAKHVSEADRRGQPGRTRLSAEPRAGRRDPRGTRDAILQAARAVLARVGPEGVSLSEVARAAGVNRGTAYQHFKSREQLIAATAEWSSGQLKAAVFGDSVASAEPGRPVEVARVAKGLANFAVRHPEMGQAWLFQTLSSADPSQDPFWREYHARGSRLHRTEMAVEGIDEEVLSVVMLAGVFLWPMWTGVKGRTEAERQACADRLAHELLRLSMYGVLKPEHFPDLAAELQQTAPRPPREAAAADSTSRSG